MCIDVHSFVVLDLLEVLLIFHDISSFSITSPAGFAPSKSYFDEYPSCQGRIFFWLLSESKFLYCKLHGLGSWSNGSTPRNLTCSPEKGPLQKEMSSSNQDFSAEIP